MATRPPLMLVASAKVVGRYGGIQHFAHQDETRTICNKPCEGWMVMRAADLQKDLESAWTCKLCKSAIHNA